ncbi:hypothetical protein Trydic_g180 [Trypoxylus dichotomus]
MLCGLEFDNYTIALVDCSQKPRPQHLPSHFVPSVCRKSIQKVQGRIRVVRGCGYIEDHDHDDGSCYFKTGTHDVHITHCSCTESACNRGHSDLDRQTPASLIAKRIRIEVKLIGAVYSFTSRLSNSPVLRNVIANCPLVAAFWMNMLWMTKRRYIKRFTLTALKVFTVLFITIFIIPPFIFKYSYRLQQNVVFPAFVNIPRNPNYSNPSKYELPGSRNLYIESENHIQLGVWHVLPETLLRNTNVTNKDDRYFDEALNSGERIIIYNHGNSANRATTYRIAMYKVLRKFFHVIAYDYRGYGDSTDVPPTEIGVVNDCLTIYRWVQNRTSAKIFIWGHSLGTAISTHAASILSTQDIKPFGLILESPFTNMRDEISEYPLSKLFSFLPWFHSTIVEPMQENKFIFATDRHILNVDCPILILHAEDDRIVPFHLGFKLYREALKYRKPRQGSVEFIELSRVYGYGHKQIFRAPELPRVIDDFVKRAIQEMESAIL